MDFTFAFPWNYSRERLWKCIENAFKLLEYSKTNVLARIINKMCSIWAWKDALLLGVVIFVLCMTCCKWRKRQQGNAKTKVCIVRSKGVIVNIETQLLEMGINVTKDDKIPKIALRNCVSRLEDEISGCLGHFSDEEIVRTILLLLYKAPTGYNMHGRFEDPNNIRYSSETPDYYRYKKLKGIICLQFDQNGKINFENCDARAILKRLITEIQDEIDKM